MKTGCVYKLPIITLRLKLEPCGSQWATACYEAVDENREHLAGTMTWDPLVATPESIMVFQEKQKQMNNMGQALSCVLLKSDANRYLGQIGAVFREEGNVADIGYWIRGSEAGKGYISEALCALRDFLFRETAVQRVIASFLPNNIASKRVMEKAGMRPSGKKRRCIEGTSKKEQEVPIFAITREEWLQKAEAFS